MKRIKPWTGDGHALILCKGELLICIGSRFIIQVFHLESGMKYRIIVMINRD